MIYWGFGPFWAAGTKRNSGPGPETEKHNFPELGALLGGKSVRPKIFTPKLRNFFTSCVFADRTPQGREIAKYWFFRPFWPRAAPWHLKNFRDENRKTQVAGTRGTFGEKSIRPKSFSPKLRNFFTLHHILCFGRADPHGLEIAKSQILVF